MGSAPPYSLCSWLYFTRFIVLYKVEVGVGRVSGSLLGKSMYVTAFSGGMFKLRGNGMKQRLRQLPDVAQANTYSIVRGECTSARV